MTPTSRRSITAYLAVVLLMPCVLLCGADAELPPGATKKTLRPDEPTEGDLARARSMLSAWENDEPQKSPRLMRIVYWSPADREPQPEFRPRLTRVMKAIQAFYQREMESWGFPGRSIQLELSDDGLLTIHMAKGTLKSAECSEQDQRIGQEIKRDGHQALRTAGVKGEQETVVIFCNLADWDPVKRTMSHHSPYYASGDSARGTAWQVDSPLLDSASLSVKDQFITDRQYGRISLGKYNSIFVGGVCHELGHALGLPHCKECPADRTVRGTALMGSGNRTFGDELRGEGRGSFLSLAHALKLAAHPQFSGSVKGLETKIVATFSNWNLIPNEGGLQVSGTVRGNLPIHAVLGYADPEGNGDYDSEVGVGIPQSDGSFALQLPRSSKKNTRAALHFVAVSVNGAASASVWSAQAFTLPSRIGGDSAYDVAKAVEKLELDEHLAAFREGKLTDVARAKLSAPTQALFKRLSAADSAAGKDGPAAAPATLRALLLSDAAPRSARTGYGGVHYDRTSDGKPLVGPDGPLANGLYAHADSLYEYDLGGGWHTLTGSACLLQNGQGSIEAVITGDGRVLWTSGTLKAGEAKPFKVEVKDIQTLKLEIKGIKGNNGAWGAWGEVELKR